MSGGSIESVEIRGRTFAVTADADAKVVLGGFKKEVKINGNGTRRTVKTRVPWSISGVSISLDSDKGDHEFLQQIADQSEDVPVVLTYADGTSYQGKGTLVDDLEGSTMESTAECKLSGGGKLTKQ